MLGLSISWGCMSPCPALLLSRLHCQLAPSHLTPVAHACPSDAQHALVQASVPLAGGVPARAAPAAGAAPEAKRRREEVMVFDESALTGSSGV